MSDQLSLFGPESEPARSAADPLRRSHEEARTLADRLPPDIYFGTSSWSFPGWAGIVYSSGRSTAALAREGLREYARHPLLRTVGIDRSYYAPIPDDDLSTYAEQLPSGFRCCIKAPASVTSATRGARGSETANPDFLSVNRLVEDLLDSLSRRFAAQTGPIILEFPPFARGRSPDPDRFLDRLEGFVEELPPGFEYAIELRDQSLLTPRYHRLLERHRLAHTYNYWSAMPMLAEQASIVPPEDTPFTVLRLLLKPGTWYEDQREAFRPFNRLVAPDPLMRRQVLTLAGRALQRHKRVFILVNNKAEGSSPLTIVALARAMIEARERSAGRPNAD